MFQRSLKGYSQKYGIDFEETFVPVVQFSSLRMLLAFAVRNNMIIHQITAYRKRYTCNSLLGMKSLENGL